MYAFMHAVHSPLEVTDFRAPTDTSRPTSAYVTVLNGAFIGHKEISASACKDSQRWGTERGDLHMQNHLVFIFITE